MSYSALRCILGIVYIRKGIVRGKFRTTVPKRTDLQKMNNSK